MEGFLRFRAYGHPAVKATHPTTLEVTREAELTPRGDCIVAVKAEYGASTLPGNLKSLLREAGSKVYLKLEAAGFSFEVKGEGHPGLTLTHPTDLVVRKSSYLCPRTLMVHADKAAADIPRPMVEVLKKGTPVLIEIRVKV
ncbi:MAG: DUF371 domain-containing protein [Candidatus Hecatellaceae archaeon]